MKTTRKIILILLILLAPSFWLFPQEKESAIKDGNASWYGDEFAGRRTASGEIFNPEGYTAAHRTLPFDTKLKVTNIKNNKAVVVRVNDRGPFVEDRVVDVSKKAALYLDMVGAGVTKVTYQIVPLEVPTGEWKDEYEKYLKGEIITYDDMPAVEDIDDGTDYSSKRILQIAAFATRRSADMMNQRLLDNGIASSIEETEQGIFRVVVANIALNEVEKYLELLKELGYTGVLIRIQR